MPASNGASQDIIVDPTVDPEEEPLHDHDPLLEGLEDDDMTWTVVKKSRKGKQKEQQAGRSGSKAAGSSGATGHCQQAPMHHQQHVANGDHRAQNGAHEPRHLPTNRQQQHLNTGGEVRGRAGGRAAAGAAPPGLEQDPFARPAVPMDALRPSSGRPHQQQYQQQRPPRRGRGRRQG